MNKIKGIIFDFDGVILNSVNVKTDAFAKMYEKYGETVVKHVLIHHLDNGGMSRYEKIKYYHENFLKEILTVLELDKLAKQFSDLVINKVVNAPYIPGAFQFIKKYSKKLPLFICTGTPTGEINEILERKNLARYFTGVYGSPEKKESHIKEIMECHNLKPSSLVFYGDSKIDLEAAEYFGISFILIKNDENKELFRFFKGKAINNFLEE